MANPYANQYINAALDHLDRRNGVHRDAGAQHQHPGRGRGRGGRGGARGAPRGAARGRGGNNRGNARGGAARGRAYPPPAAPGAPAPPAGPPARPPGLPAVQPAPPPPPAPAPDPAPIALTRPQVIQQWLAAFRPRVSRPNFEAAQLAFPGVQFLVEEVGVQGVNPHELLAVARVMATVQALAVLALEHRADTPQHVDFLWGANRDFMVLGTLNNRLQAHNMLPIEGHMVGDQVVAADQHRRPVPVAGPHSPYGLMVNVYCHGEHSEEVTPSWLGALGYEHLVWVGHPFQSFYGRVLTGYWLRVKEDGMSKVRWFADTLNPEYTPHPPCEAMHVSGAHLGIQWHTVKTVSCTQYAGASATQKLVYDIVQVSARQARESAITSVRETPQVIVEIDIPDIPGYLAWVREHAPIGIKTIAIWCAEYLANWGLVYAPKTKVLFDKRDFHAAVRFLSNKGRHQYSFRALQTEVDRMLSDPTSHDDFIYLERVAPEYFLYYRWYLCLAAFTYEAEAQSIQLQAVQKTYGAAFDMSNRAVKGIDTPAPHVAASRLGVQVGAVAVAHFVLLRVPGVGRVYRQLWYSVGNAVVQAAGAAVSSLLGLRTASGATDYLRPVGRTVSSAHARVVEYTNRAWTSVQGAVAPPTQAVMEQAEPSLTPAQQSELRRLSEGVGELAAGTATWFTRIILERGIMILVVAPVAEEAFKQLFKLWGRTPHILACMFVGFADVRAWGVNPFSVMGVLWLGLMSTVHYRFSRGGYWAGVRSHSKWNLYAIIINSALRAICGTPMWADTGFVRTASGAVDWFASTEALWMPTLFLVGILIAKLWRRRAPKMRDPVLQFDEEHYCVRSREADQLLPTPQPVMHSNGDPAALDQTRLIVPINEERRFVAPFTTARLPPPPVDPTVIIARQQTAFSGPNDNEGGGYYRVWGHNAPMYRPAASSDNMLAVVEQRLATAITHQAEDAAWWQVTCLLAGRWWFLPVELWDEFHRGAAYPDIKRYPRNDGVIGDLDEPEKVRRWLEHTDPEKRPRYVTALEVVAVSPLSPLSPKVKRIQVNVKKDEVLLKYRLKEADKGMIPRPIHNVDPLLAVTIGPDVYAASEVIKSHWRWDSQWQKDAGLCTNGRHVTITYGAGLLAEELDQWFEYVLTEPGWHILVAGDDSVVVIHRDDGSITFVEGDISKCDHSVRKAALEFEYRVLRAGGASARTVDFLRESASAICVASTRLADGGTIRIFRGPERNTGGVDTTVGNTTITGGAHYLGCATCEALSDRDVGAHFTATFARLGLELKTRVWSGRVGDIGFSYWGPSFLKGYWYPSLNGATRWKWGPLPSRMLKISKIMTDPCRVYRKPGEARPSYDLACRRHVAALYLCMRPYAWPQELLEWLRTRADPAWAERVPIEEWDGPWRPKPRAEPVSIDQSWVAQAAWWYDTRADEVMDWLGQLQSLEVGAFSFHPFWVKMALKDYN